MSEKKEQAKPLAPAARHLNMEANHPAFSPEFMSPRHQRCIKFAGCSLAILSIIVTILLALAFTVFHIKDPVLNIDFSDIRGFDNWTGLDRGLNVTIEADVSIRNPNVASFKIRNMSMDLYYDGLVVSRGRVLPGEVRARRTLRMNVSIEVRADEILKVRRSEADLGVGILPVNSLVSVDGRVKISSGNKRNLVVRMNCTMNLNMRIRRVEDQNCWG